MKVKQRLPLEELKRKERQERDARVARRMRIIILATEGWTAPAIAMAVGLSRRICQAWVQKYNEGGISALANRQGRPAKLPLSSKQQEQLQKRLNEGPLPEDDICTLRGRDVRKILDNEFGTCRSLATTYRILHKLGYSCLRPRPKHEKSDPKAIEQFKESFPGMVRDVAETRPNKTLRIYFQDEARFGQQGTMTTVWARTGSRPRAVRQTRYGYIWAIGAVCPETGHAEGLLSPCLNTEMMNQFLRQFSKTLPDDEHALMVWDGAGFHRSGSLVVPENVSLIQLPPYSPELNPIENLWRYLKSHYWSNRAYADYDALLEAAVTMWKSAVLDADLMKTVCNAPYASKSRWNK